jgi:cell division protein FtsN
VTPKSGTAASQTTTDPLTQVGSGIQNFFGNLFSGVTAPGTAPTTASINRPARPAATSGWNSTTTTATAKTNSTSLKPVRVQVAAVRGQTEAKAIATRVNSQLKGALPGQSADVRRVNVGNMGALYRVEIGPFASERESRPACAALRKAGYDCLVLR